MATAFKIVRENEVTITRKSFDEKTPDNYKLVFNFQVQGTALSSDISVDIFDDKGNYAGHSVMYMNKTGDSTNVNFDVDDLEDTMKQLRKEVKSIKAEYPQPVNPTTTA